ncbi:hypothetical protein GCM10028862_16720 [Luteimonas pelagia]
MRVTNIAPMGLLSADKAAELRDGMGRVSGQKILGTWCAETGWCVRVLVVSGVPTQWWMQGPMSREEAREALTGKADVGSVH